MLVETNLPHSRWEYAAQHAVYVHNRIASVKAQFLCYQTDRKGIIAYSREPTPHVWKTQDYKFVTLAGSTRSQGLDVGKEAIKKELAALDENDTGTLMPLPPGAKALDNTVQFRLKQDREMKLIYKARVCARGDKQPRTIGTIEVYAPVATLSLIRVVLAVVAKSKLKMRQADVPSAYVNATLSDVIYLRQVKGFERPGKETWVWKLNKALYGLHQAGAEWYREMDGFLRSIGLVSISADPCVYVSPGVQYKFIPVLYVDDILIAYEQEPEMKRVLSGLEERYSVKDLGVPCKFLGMNVSRLSDGTVRLDLSTQVREMLHRFGVDHAMPTLLPMEAATRIEKAVQPISADEKRTMVDVSYRQQ
ncbi:putative mitochondrial protein [Phytophthora megakarya]|uniref:Putative mitochondrial protein n=1 Tax=Phytophthora megakarya TaxID=4795 RepID=A0A225UWZ8_9STRA|nr:putative mitochondrial protein [Phytophthora megakarya]